MWIFFALLGPFFWAIIHLLDSHCIEKVFDRPWMGVITSSLSSLVTFLILPFAAPFVVWEISGWDIVGLALLTGALIQISQAFYFQALEYSEAGTVAAYSNITTILLPIVSFIFLDQNLELGNYLGMIGLVACSGCFCLLDQSVSGRSRSFFYMLLACSAQVGVLLLEKHIFEHISCSFLVFLLVTVGFTVSGFCPLLLSPVRKAFQNNISSLKTAMAIIIGIDIINFIAIFCGQQAVRLGTPSLVAAIETTTPAYTFFLSALLLLVLPRYADPRVRHQFKLKLLLVSLMVIGVGLVSSDLTLASGTF